MRSLRLIVCLVGLVAVLGAVTEGAHSEAVPVSPSPGGEVQNSREPSFDWTALAGEAVGPVFSADRATNPDGLFVNAYNPRAINAFEKPVRYFPRTFRAGRCWWMLAGTDAEGSRITSGPWQFVVPQYVELEHLGLGNATRPSGGRISQQLSVGVSWASNVYAGGTYSFAIKSGRKVVWKRSGQWGIDISRQPAAREFTANKIVQYGGPRLKGARPTFELRVEGEGARFSVRRTFPAPRRLGRCPTCGPAKREQGANPRRPQAEPRSCIQGRRFQP